MKRLKVYQLSNFKLRYELLKGDRQITVFLKKKSNYKAVITKWYNKLVAVMQRVHLTERRLPKWSALSHRKVPISWLIIAFLLGILLSGQRVHVIPQEQPVRASVKLTGTIKQTPLQPQALLQTVYIPPPEPTPVIGNCGSDYYQQLVYQRESGCRTNAVNYLGCAGIGQACPGSKLPCTLYDWTCQNNFFTNYMLSVYGSWGAAWNSEVIRGWW